MNIKPSYQKEMLALLEKWSCFRASGLSTSTAGQAVAISGNTTGDNYGSCGGFMANLYKHAGKGGKARNFWPTPTVDEAKSKMSLEEFEKIIQLWIQMMGEIMIPIRYVGIQNLEESGAGENIKVRVKGSSRYQKVFVTEHDYDNYVNYTHFKMAHTALRYLFRSDMMDAAYHTMKMKLENPNITVLDCLVTASYYCKMYYSPMMLFRWYFDNININSIGKLPLPRNRGQIAQQLLRQSKSNSTNGQDAITSFYTDVYEIEKGDKEALDFQAKFVNVKTGSKSSPPYLETLKSLRGFALKSKKISKAIVS